jgi:hypothetical protein
MRPSVWNCLDTHGRTLQLFLASSNRPPRTNRRMPDRLNWMTFSVMESEAEDSVGGKEVMFNIESVTHVLTPKK